MENTNESNSNEIKPSFTFSHFFLTILVVLITTIITVYVTNYLNNRENKLTISKKISANLVTNNATKKELIAKYYLNTNLKEEVKSAFLQTIVLKNNGDEDIFDLKVIFKFNNDEIKPSESSEVSTEPTNLKSILKQKSFQFDKESNSYFYMIDLLKPNESIKIDNILFSQKTLNIQDVDIFARQKNLTVEIKQLEDDKKVKVRSKWGLYFVMGLLFPNMMMLSIFLRFLQIAMKNKEKINIFGTKMTDLDNPNKANYYYAFMCLMIIVSNIIAFFRFL